jgi:selenocysteine-specific elongation factor
VGGGTVIDPDAPERRRRSPERLACLDAIQRLLLGEGIVPLLEHSPQGIELQRLVRLCNLAPEHMALPPQALIVGPAGRGVVILDAHWRSLKPTRAGRAARVPSTAPGRAGDRSGRLRRISAPTIADASGAR